jgi:hypothetical protein
MGYQAMYNATTAVHDTALGYQALYNETASAADNFSTGVGWHALFSNDSAAGANRNTALGAEALESNTAGYQNTGVGAAALSGNVTGNANTAIGWNALSSNDTGNLNTATGQSALSQNHEGSSNTGDGYYALAYSRSGNFNTAVGTNAGYTVGNSPFAFETTGSYNIALGANAGYNWGVGSNNNINIGNPGADESNTIRIGGDTGFGSSQTATFIAGISGAAVAGTGVVVDGNGHLGVLVSSARFKDDITPMDKASEAILSLRPVTFRYKHELDPKGTIQFGLVAQEVEKVNPDLVSRDADGEPLTVRYDAVNAMLLNEFLKEHRKVEDLEATVAQLKSTVAEQKKDFAAQLKQLDSKIQTVNDKVEFSKPAPQTVNDQ